MQISSTGPSRMRFLLHSTYLSPESDWTISLRRRRLFNRGIYPQFVLKISFVVRTLGSSLQTVIIELVNDKNLLPRRLYAFEPRKSRLDGLFFVLINFGAVDSKL